MKAIREIATGLIETAPLMRPSPSEAKGVKIVSSFSGLTLTAPERLASDGAADGLFDGIGGDEGANDADKGDKGKGGWSKGC